MKAELLTVSTIARRSGLDRRTIERGILDVEPAERQPQVRYAVPAVQSALAGDGQDSTAIARLSPFGASPTRLIAWNTLATYVRGYAEELADSRGDWQTRFGLTPLQATQAASYAAVLAEQVADHLLAHADNALPDAQEYDDLVLGFKVPGENARPGEFMARPQQLPPTVAAMHSEAAASLTNKPKRAGR